MVGQKKKVAAVAAATLFKEDYGGQVYSELMSVVRMFQTQNTHEDWNSMPSIVKM